MDWAARLLGLSPVFLNSSGVGGGVIQVSEAKVNRVALADLIQTTASDSSLVAVVAARSRYQVEHPNCMAEELVIYTTTQTHSLGTKAGLVLGLQVRTLEVQAEDRYSLRGTTLRSALVKDEKLGRRPFILSMFFHTHTSANLLVIQLQPLGPHHPAQLTTYRK